jgi:hypothetical protein
MFSNVSCPFSNVGCTDKVTFVSYLDIILIIAVVENSVQINGCLIGCPKNAFSFAHAISVHLPVCLPICMSVCL